MQTRCVPLKGLHLSQRVIFHNSVQSHTHQHHDSFELDILVHPVLGLDEALFEESVCSG